MKQINNYHVTELVFENNPDLKMNIRKYKDGKMIAQVRAHDMNHVPQRYLMQIIKETEEDVVPNLTCTMSSSIFMHDKMKEAIIEASNLMQINIADIVIGDLNSEMWFGDILAELKQEKLQHS